jgi:hypothetical protein
LPLSVLPTHHPSNHSIATSPSYSSTSS